jgi:hypothetical protein
MDYLRIYKLNEKDFDGIVQASGGKRLSSDETRERYPNADYQLGDAIIELKFLEEEGLEKKQRQQKLAALFNKCCFCKPVMVLATELLDNMGKKEYCNIMSTPIRGHVKSAARQLKQTAKRHNVSAKVALLINSGYGSLNHEEFKDIAYHCVINHTKQIDRLIVGGIYFYSDKFDHYVIGPFEEIPINLNSCFSDFDNLKQHWDAFLNDFMTSVVLGNRADLPERLPVLDIGFEVDGVKYVKPSPPIGKPSEFWVKGRPRENSTGITQCPPVAKTFPKMNKEDWLNFKEMMPEETDLRDTYSDWLRFTDKESEAYNKVLQPFVTVEVEHEDFSRNRQADKANPTFRELCLYANEVFDRNVKELIKSAIDKAKSNIILPAYIFLLVEEIGQDKANDLCSIYCVRQSLGQQNPTVVLENAKLFFKYGLALAASYAIKYDVSFVVYERDQTYMWR